MMQWENVGRIKANRKAIPRMAQKEGWSRSWNGKWGDAETAV